MTISTRRLVVAAAALTGAAVLLSACGTSTTDGTDRSAVRVHVVTAAPTPADATPTDAASGANAAARATARATGSPTPRTGPGGTTDSRPLSARAPGQQIAYARVNGEAATYDQRGNIAFWVFTQSGWLKVGASTYPARAADDEPVLVTGVELPDPAEDEHNYGQAVTAYVVSAQFTTDGASNEAVYSDGAQGWGALERSGSTLVSHGRPASVAEGRGLVNYAGASSQTGVVTTAVCSPDLPIYQCSPTTRLTTRWTWDNTLQGLRATS